jgi:hypothetical protein
MPWAWYTPCISIVNVDHAMMEEVARILKAHGIPCYIHRCDWARHPKNRITTRVVISGLRRCAVALPVILPYLRGKREVAELLWRFCERRTSAVIGRGRVRGIYQTLPYDDEEEELFRRIRELNRVGSSEAMSRASAIAG